MATVVVGCMCVQSTMVEGTHIIQTKPENDLFPEIIYWLLTCCHGNCTNPGITLCKV